MRSSSASRKRADSVRHQQYQLVVREVLPGAVPSGTRLCCHFMGVNPRFDLSYYSCTSFEFWISGGGPGLKAPQILLPFRGVTPPALSGILYLQL